MSWIDRTLPAERSLEDLKYFLQITLLTFFGYLVAAELAFFVGTLSDKIFAPFWPPNIVLLSAILIARRGWRWIADSSSLSRPCYCRDKKIGMSLSELLAAFATNLAVAALSAAAIQSQIGQRPWFSTFRSTANFIFIVGFVCPAIAAFGGAFVPVLGGGGVENYWNFWTQWFASNALGNLALGPLALVLATEGPRAFWAAKCGAPDGSMPDCDIAYCRLRNCLRAIRGPTRALLFSRPCFTYRFLSSFGPHRALAPKEPARQSLLWPSF